MQIVGRKVARDMVAKRSLSVYLSHFLFIQIAIDLQLFNPITLTTPHIVNHWRILFQTSGILLASTMVALAFELTVQRWIDRGRRSLFYSRKGPQDSFRKGRDLSVLSVRTQREQAVDVHRRAGPRRSARLYERPASR